VPGQSKLSLRHRLGNLQNRTPWPNPSGTHLVGGFVRAKQRFDINQLFPNLGGTRCISTIQELHTASIDRLAYGKNSSVRSTVRRIIRVVRTYPLKELEILSEIAEFNRRCPSGPCSVPDTYANIVAYMLKINGFHAKDASLRAGDEKLDK
jgi:hypothetical protein